MMYVQIIAGFVFLLGGADILVRGAVALAKKWDVSPLVIGMTIIAFGTSAPEFLVSMDAALAGSSAMALGNIIGSNLANMLLILGVAAMLKPISVKPYAMLRDGLTLLVGTLLFVWFVMDGDIGVWQGAALLGLFVFFIGHSWWRETHGSTSATDIYIHEAEEYEDSNASVRVMWMMLLAGLAGVIFGADQLVKGGVDIARAYGVSEEVIGLTMLAFGTSLPELAASVVAALRGHADVALGNVVGSNMFNTLAVVGGVAMVTPLAAPAQIVNFDLWVMLGVTVLVMPYLVGGWRLTRPVAVVFLLAYVAYVAAQVTGVANLV
ncbi:MAG: calcium/sodium antiporter [Alphaproteobacteria bacterium]